MKLSIIIPVYNEEKNLPYIKKELFPVIKNIDYEIIFVNDGSEDNTLNEIKKLKSKKIKIYNHKKNQGLGSAIRTAIPKCKSKYTLTLDSDLTFHPRYIPTLVKRIEKGDVDCVIGSPNLSKYDDNIPFYRIFLSKSVNFIYTILLGQKITAVSPIFRIYKTEQLQELKLESERFQINAEILAKLFKKKREVVEIPTKLTKRKYGESKLNSFKETINHLKLMLKILKWRLVK